MICKDEEFIPICEFDAENEIKFTKEFLALTKELGGGARRFAAMLITHWDVSFTNMLDWFGPVDSEADKYSGIDGEPMDVREDVTDLWEYHGIPFDGLDGEFYRDVLRSKLVTLKLPKRVIKAYVEVAKKATMKG